jgi:hypothetical protein
LSTLHLPKGSEREDCFYAYFIREIHPNLGFPFRGSGVAPQLEISIFLIALRTLFQTWLFGVLMVGISFEGD